MISHLNLTVCSAVGLLPLSLQYGSEVMQQFLRGARSIDQHFQHAPLQQNLPVLLGLLGMTVMTVIHCFIVNAL